MGGAHTGRACLPYCMDGPASRAHHSRVRVLPHVKKLDDCFGDFLVRVSCPCGASRHIQPEALARIAGRSVTFAKLATRMRRSNCGKKVAERTIAESPAQWVQILVCS